MSSLVAMFVDRDTRRSTGPRRDGLTNREVGAVGMLMLHAGQPAPELSHPPFATGIGVARCVLHRGGEGIEMNEDRRGFITDRSASGIGAPAAHAASNDGDTQHAGWQRVRAGSRPSLRKSRKGYFRPARGRHGPDSRRRRTPEASALGRPSSYARDRLGWRRLRCGNR
jgi:hypothetical protein